jgi:hypothetical protein
VRFPLRVERTCRSKASRSPSVGKYSWTETNNIHRQLMDWNVGIFTKPSINYTVPFDFFIGNFTGCIHGTNCLTETTEPPKFIVTGCTQRKMSLDTLSHLKSTECVQTINTIASYKASAHARNLFCTETKYAKCML